MIYLFSIGNWELLPSLPVSIGPRWTDGKTTLLTMEDNYQDITLKDTLHPEGNWFGFSVEK